jgi:hypothetical protein
MNMRATTIGGAARDRFAEWAPAARTQDGSRSLPGSPRLTDQDIWSATHRGVATDKSQCGSALTETARPGREDGSNEHRCGFMPGTCGWPRGQKTKSSNTPGAPIRSVEASPLRVATGGNACEGTQARCRRLPDAANPRRGQPQKKGTKNDERLRTS